ncbi:MAG: prepilin-type N-terminal cleavage/methylation domain-containing protein [Phycisphaerales bacterium]|nr:prepilin-type N-terminal cleavage/methylation domain-containing protein [Phycisphaerales bacterium]
MTQSLQRRAFTLVELMVAIGIILVLVGILLPALGRVSTKARATSTQSTMNEFAKACDNFYLQFGYYPGIIPENVLAATVNPAISGTENALLHLMGGAIRSDDPIYTGDTGTVLNFGNATTGLMSIKVTLINIGKGPRVEGRQYESFFTPKDAQMKIAPGQIVNGAVEAIGDPAALPDLVDAWGQPIGYVRAAKTTGLLSGIVSDNPQFYFEPLVPYFRSTALGEMSLDQNATSVFGSATGTAAQHREFLAQLIRHPAMGSFTTLTDAKTGTPRGKYFLFSPGADGIYFAKIGDGPTPVTTFVFTSVEARRPDVVTSYNDIVVSGGG